MAELELAELELAELELAELVPPAFGGALVVLGLGLVFDVSPVSDRLAFADFHGRPTTPLGLAGGTGFGRLSGGRTRSGSAGPYSL